MNEVWEEGSLTKKLQSAFKGISAKHEESLLVFRY